MKIRSGFVSNSSSSSFIVRRNYLDFTKYEEDRCINYNKLKQDIIKMVLRYYKNKGEDENFIKQETTHLNEGIQVDSLYNLVEKLRFWYAPAHLCYMDDVVIYAEDDNLIPYKVFEKIKKKFDLVEYVDCYNHMG